MAQEKKNTQEKEDLHPRNKHRERYNFETLIEACPELGPFVTKNKYENQSINFSDPKAVVTLNTAILKRYYGLTYWAIPEGHLCPPVPGRADYIHYVADLLAIHNEGKAPKGENIKCIDIGVGANCIYPIIGVSEYGWSFVGADLAPESISSAQHIVSQNDTLKNNVELRLQAHSYNTFKGIIKDNERFDLTICNPPFHSSLEEAHAGTLRKLSSITKKEVKDVVLNFGGNGQELFCNGGEERFITNMIKQSSEFGQSCLWFTTLVSKKENIRTFKKMLKKVAAVEVKTIPMHQGTKTSRLLAWTFQNEEQRVKWASKNW